MLGGNSRTGEGAWYDPKAEAGGGFQKERRGDLGANVSHWPARQRVMRLVELVGLVGTHKDPLHLTTSYWIEFFAFFSPLKRARGLFFDQGLQDTFMDEIHAPFCQKRRTN